MQELVIGDEGRDHIRFEIANHFAADTADSGDENWLNCDISLSAGGFKGRFSASMRTTDFTTFYRELSAFSQTFSGEAGLDTMEGQVFLWLSPGKSGQVTVNGKVMDVAGIGNRLTFRFEINQTSLPRILSQLEEVTSMFPVKSAP